MGSTANQRTTVSGTRQGNRVELVLAGEVRFTDEGIDLGGEGLRERAERNGYDLCRRRTLPAFTGELVDGRYEDEQVNEYPPPLSQGTVTVHTLIEQKGQENAGAPVG